MRSRQGGNYTQPHREYGSHDVSYLVFVGGVRQPQEYTEEFEAANALRAVVYEEWSVPAPELLTPAEAEATIAEFRKRRVS